MNLKTPLLTALLLAGAGTLASAQSATDWTGFYLGANAGYGFGKSDVTTDTVFSPTGYFATASVPQIHDACAWKISVHGFTAA
jgi:opacity protein-like surface antigen